MASEIELKLDVTLAAAAEIESSTLFESAPKTAEQVAIYFDTPDHALSKAGLSLRIRRVGDDRIQTVKAQGGSTAGLFARSEWEQSVVNDDPVLDETTPVRAVLGKAADDVAPIFEVRIQRRTWHVREGRAAIEMVIDRGEVRSGDGASSITEIELELEAGDPDALFALARRIDAVAPVRLGVLSKSERGYRLAKASAASMKAERIVLTGDMTAESAFQHIIQSCVRHFRLNEAALAQTRDADALHQARVALRRLRSAFSIFRAIARGKDANRLRMGLKHIAAALGDARNLDVLLERAEPDDLHDRLAEAREASYARAEAALGSAATRMLMLDLAQWTALGEWRRNGETKEDRELPVCLFASDVLTRLRRKVKKEGRHLGSAGDEARHEVRKDAKKLRYAAEFFSALFDRKGERRRYKRFVEALEAMQDQLGLLNDIATAGAVLESIGLAAEATPLLPDEDRRSALIQAAAEAYEDLIDTKRFWA